MPRAGTSASPESGDVDVTVEVSFGSDEEPRPPGAGSDRRGRLPSWQLTTVLAAVAALLVGLLLWPPASSGTRSDAAQQPSVAGWPARGTLAADPDLARAAAASWRSAGRGAGITAPGPDIGVVFLDDRDGALTTVLHSRTPDGQLLVAVGRATGPGGAGDLQIIDAVPVPDDPPWLTLPGGEHPRLLVAPDLAQQSALLLRRADGRWSRLAIGDDGVSAPVRGLGDQPPLVGVVDEGRPPRALRDVHAVSATSLLPVPGPVSVSDPVWGQADGPTPEEYDAALTVGAALAPTSDDPIAVISETRIRDGRAVLAEIARPDGVKHVLVATGADGVPRLAGSPRVSDSLALGLLPRDAGRWLVLVGAAPGVDSFEVRTWGGRTLIGGAGSAAVVVPAPAPAGVVVHGWRADGSPVDRVSLPIALAGSQRAA